jgi:hypothetical protein
MNNFIPGSFGMAVSAKRYALNPNLLWLGSSTISHALILFQGCKDWAYSSSAPHNVGACGLRRFVGLHELTVRQNYLLCMCRIIDLLCQGTASREVKDPGPNEGDI